MKTILLTGFQPFLDHSQNPSQLLCEEFQGFQTAGTQVQSLTLPVTFEGAYQQAQEKIQSLKPDILIATGLSAKRTNICLEKLAANWVDCESPDNNGIIKQQTKIIESAPDTLSCNLPIDSLFDHLKQKDFNVELSLNAGHYVCNYLYYLLRKEHPKLPCMFIHIPHSDIENTKACFQEIILWLTTFMANKAE